MVRSAGAHQDTACRKLGHFGLKVYLSLEKFIRSSLTVIKDSRGAFEVCNRDSLWYLNIYYPERCSSPISSVLYLSAVCGHPWYLERVVMANTQHKEPVWPQQMTLRLKFIRELGVEYSWIKIIRRFQDREEKETRSLFWVLKWH